MAPIQEKRKTKPQGISKISRSIGKKKILGLKCVPRTYDMYAYEIAENSQKPDFKITKLFSPEDSRRCIKDHSKAQIIRLENIPDVWSLDNLADVFNILGELANFKSQARGVDAVKAILEIGLSMPLEDINVTFQDKVLEGNSSVGDRRKKNANFVNRFLNYTMGKHQNFKYFYEKTFGMKPNACAVGTFGDAARLLISWFASYLLLNAFVDRPDVIRSRMESNSLVPLSETKELKDVHDYYSDFLKTEIGNYVQLNITQFQEAKFLSKLSW